MSTLFLYFANILFLNIIFNTILNIHILFKNYAKNLRKIEFYTKKVLTNSNLRMYNITIEEEKGD